MMKPISDKGTKSPFTSFTTFIASVSNETLCKTAKASAIYGVKPPSRGFALANNTCPSQSRITTPRPTTPRVSSSMAFILILKQFSFGGIQRTKRLTRSTSFFTETA
ncbi:hypothetical protein ACOSQ4_015656 [Xanthoceras sorbifolium]